MPTLTVDLPETAYRAALAFPAPERARMIAATFTLDSDEGYDDDPPPTEDDLAAIGRGLQAVAEGRTVPGDIALARFREQFRLK